jgi:Cft2 family RNA processing exonuclease
MLILYTVFKENPASKIPVYIDSPMTQKVTEIYEKNCSLLNISKEVFSSIHEHFSFVQYSNQKK